MTDYRATAWGGYSCDERGREADDCNPGCGQSEPVCNDLAPWGLNSVAINLRTVPRCVRPVEEHVGEDTMEARQLKLAIALLTAFAGVGAIAADMPGVTPKTINIGSIFPFSGPASLLGNAGKALIAYVRSINDRGGVNGRTIEFVTYDDAYSPTKAVEQARKLVESEEVSFLFSQLGTPGNAATIKYLNARKVPGAFVVSAAHRFANFQEYPYTTTGLTNVGLTAIRLCQSGKALRGFDILYRASLTFGFVGLLLKNFVAFTIAAIPLRRFP